MPPSPAHGQARRPGRGLSGAGAGGRRSGVAAGHPKKGEREENRGAAAPLLTPAQADGLGWLCRPLAAAREAQSTAPAAVAGADWGG